MIQSSHRFGLTASSPNLSESSLGGLRSSASLRSPSERSQPTQPNWIQTNLEAKRRDRTGGLIESHKLKAHPPPLPSGYATGLPSSSAGQQNAWAIPKVHWYPWGHPRLRQLTSLPLDSMRGWAPWAQDGAGPLQLDSQIVLFR